MNEIKIRYQLDDKGEACALSSKPQKRKGTTSDRDCMAKKEILAPLLQYPDGLTSKELFNISEFQGTYNNFTSHLSKYCRGGKKTRFGRMGDSKYVYLYKVGKRPSKYVLTEFGRINAENPYLNRDEAIRIYRQKIEHTVGRFLDEHPDRIPQIQVSGSGGYGSNPVNSKDFGDIGDYHGHESKIEELQAKIKELQAENEGLIDRVYELSKPRPMIVNKQPEPTQPQEPTKSDERSFDNILWAYKDKQITESAYKQLPKQIIQLTAMPRGNISESIKLLLRGKKIGDYVVESKEGARAIMNHGLGEPLRKNEIESLIIKFHEGDVYLISQLGRFKITTTPKGKPTTISQHQVKINTQKNCS